MCIYTTFDLTYILNLRTYQSPISLDNQSSTVCAFLASIIPCPCSAKIYYFFAVVSGKDVPDEHFLRVTRKLPVKVRHYMYFTCLCVHIHVPDISTCM